MPVSICPRCGNMWLYSGKATYPQCSRCRTHFKLTPSRRVSRADDLYRRMFYG